MAEVHALQTGLVIPFPDAATRALRTPPASNGPRGEILLFTGIRYEWGPAPSPAPSTPVAPGGGSRAGRRRRPS
jgi:hypothetical protein